MLIDDMEQIQEKSDDEIDFNIEIASIQSSINDNDQLQVKKRNSKN